ncbi:hypothetical protein DACRYDRAFT_108183 [Dacryopinax primogenitus]|uniref:Concanavalin A-like lectin/glucanase n=1 Tax=Dacryopinax primogenitus (strain DJM 731) TaxID=1858805 RepID=M5G761_DACPD|nr:uncharacterized protein DACRYDRAFT_108183 [Dacryopinax primogenitus]EJU01652.1 hypothetical protein DACRYDRAFT_108183 [Dacryopinax primogenitus]
MVGTSTSSQVLELGFTSTLSETLNPMLSTLILGALALLAQPTHAISWGLFTPSGNPWIQMVFTQHVPQGPPSDVNSGPWFFWCGLQPNGGGVLQPPGNQGQPDGLPAIQSEGFWVDEGAQIVGTVTWENGQWGQTAQVISGQAAGQSISLTSQTNYFQGETPGFDNTNFAVCDAELDGSQTGEWNFPVVFTDLFIRAATSDGIEALCADTANPVHSAGAGSIQFEGFSMLDAETCHWSTVTLLPP